MMAVKLRLHVSYPPEYPDVYPNVSLTPEDEDDEGGDMDLTPEEKTQLLQGLEEIVRHPFFHTTSLVTDAERQGSENIGTAMTFTLVSHLREQLFQILQERAAKIQREEREKERKALEVSDNHTHNL
jgi:hypothetical protein